MDPSNGIITLEVTVNSPLESVWKAWTTEEGVESFFAPQALIQLKPGGSYEMYFDPEAQEGSRGGEGNVILAIQKECMLSFTWNAPPSFPEIRQHRTHVTVKLISTENSRTRVILTHDGWGEGEQWDQVFHYFEKAWGETVLPGLQKLFQ